jgi:hypothetical protein
MVDPVDFQMDWIGFDRLTRLPVAASDYPLTHRQAYYMLGGADAGIIYYC